VNNISILVYYIEAFEYIGLQPILTSGIIECRHLGGTLNRYLQFVPPTAVGNGRTSIAYVHPEPLVGLRFFAPDRVGRNSPTVLQEQNGLHYLYN